MDSRTKIVTLEAAGEAAAAARKAGRQVHLVTGWFDPVLASHAEALAAAAQQGAMLFAAVADPPEALLAARARAELVAAQRVVDYVVLAGGDPGTVQAALAPDLAIDERSSDGERRRDLERHVRDRHNPR